LKIRKQRGNTTKSQVRAVIPIRKKAGCRERLKKHRITRMPGKFMRKAVSELKKLRAPVSPPCGRMRERLIRTTVKNG
jgi:hypothetical protein